MDYSGQWIGFSEGDPRGRIVLDVEQKGSDQIGVAYLFSNRAEIPSTVTNFTFPSDESKFEMEVSINPFDAVSGQMFNTSQVRDLYPNATFSNKANLEISCLDENKLKVVWKTEIETHGQAILERSVMPLQSQLEPDSEVNSWKDFKEKVAEFRFGDSIFRGQEKAFPLQTSFHRTKRKILHYYINEDVQILHRSLTGKTSHLFDLDRPQQLGAFLNLAQHHGFPTPLLDWTYSPFVAAWFAFSDLQRNSSNCDTQPVRIFCLNRVEIAKFNQFQNVTFSPPHVSILEALAIENNRAIPQQGLLTLTNVHDIESYIFELEEKSGANLLTAYDLPCSEAETALNDLAMMGITRSTLFPSIESICIEMHDRLFKRM